MERNIIDLLKSFKYIECYYLDHKLVSKDYIDTFPKRVGLSRKKFNNNTFVLSTCLRYEIYNFSNKKWNFKDKDKFALVSGALCLRRFVSLLCGIQSEIIGEREIFLQARKSLYEGVQNNMLDKDLFWDVNNLFEIAEKIRNKYNISCFENYSTVGATLLNEKIKDSSTVVIIGGGYMVESFIKNINTSKLKQIIWINRNVDKIKKISKDLKINSKNIIEFCNLENAEKKIINADFIFAATHNCGGMFSSLNLEKKCVVDVSYPALFSEKNGCELYAISNTYFEKFIKNPTLKSSVIEAEKEIDNLF